MRRRARVVFPTLFVALAGGLLPAPPAGAADETGQFKVGVQPDGRIVVPTNQVLKPAGQQITFPGRPVDIALCDDGRLEFIDEASHWVQHEEPARVNALLEGFLSAG